MSQNNRRRVSLWSESNPPERRFLWAFVADDSSLHVNGHALGPSLVAMSGEDEIETFMTVRAEDLEQLITLLGGEPGSDILDLLEQRYTGDASGDLMAVLYGGEVPVKHFAS